ncbi:uncharacterized protein B0H18DRAFT_1009790 [Fomitopsis serialis]|uniref:uncharacterized protein n=1 Tax=Fomitopsis serialis TaxID=139415 RepID=UPI002007A88F|nr:uncharacterized protein B0H18DRAFT_1009790 [Neoantrodia serialis]KAH9925094.1 hypothetical protein B0H18DRAFT_1009790 [Neoantrodia serialis]
MRTGGWTRTGGQSRSRERVCRQEAGSEPSEVGREKSRTRARDGRCATVYLV